MQVRGIISDFAVMIAIVSMVGADAGLGLHTPKLRVPEDFKVRGAVPALARPASQYCQPERIVFENGSARLCHVTQATTYLKCKEKPLHFLVLKVSTLFLEELGRH